MAGVGAAAIYAASLDKHRSNTDQRHYVGIPCVGLDGQMTIAEAFGVPEPAAPIVTPPRPYPVLTQSTLPAIWRNAKRGAGTDTGDAAGSERDKKAFKGNINATAAKDQVIDLTSDCD